MLLSMLTSRFLVSVRTEPHVPGSGYGTKATTGAQTPARLSSASSQSVLPRSATRLTPIVTSAATRKPWTGV